MSPIVRFGLNQTAVQATTPFLNLFLDEVRDPLLLILLFASLVSCTVGFFGDTGWVEGLAVFITVGLVALITAASDFIQAREFHLILKQAGSATCTVVREGLETEIPIENLTVGDLVKIKMGMSIPADGVLTEAYGLKLDESLISGESDLVPKSVEGTDQDSGTPFLFSGTHVEEGAGKMIVCAVGSWSAAGQLKSLGVESTTRDSPLQTKLSHISNSAATIGVGSAFLTFVVLLLNIVWESGRRKGWDAKSWEALADSLMTVVAILVVAVPEGLSLAVTLTLAYSVGKMKSENNLVRNLHACETMGSVSEVCTDKTGTLTLNRMMVVGAFFLDAVSINEDDREFNLEDENLHRLFLENFCLNTDASVVMEGGNLIHIGNRTDCALLGLARRWKCDYVQMRKKFPIVTRIPFDSKLKWMGTVVTIDSHQRVYLKGAAEAVLPMCKYIYSASGEIVPLTLDQRAKIERDVVIQFSALPLRTLVLAYRDVQGMVRSNFFSPEFVLIGIFGIRDQTRPEVPEAVRSLHQANITVRMVTGDNLHTALSVAKQVGILDSENVTRSSYVVMEGSEFERCVATPDCMEIRDFPTFTRIAKDLRVLARCSPTQKYLLIRGLKQLDCVVAVTGDGCNDAPALRQADIGFAMNIVGTEVAKEAADIILLDDNFASIVTAMKWGRHIYDSIRRFLQFQMTASVSALGLCLVGAVTVNRSPLAPVQMLWVNLIIDTFAAAALTAEAPAASIMTRPPHRKGESILTVDMKKTMLSGVVYQLLVLTLLLFLGPVLLQLSPGWCAADWSDVTGLHFTLIFHTFVLMQICHEFCCRSLTSAEKNPFGGILRNLVLIFMVLLTFVAQICIVHFGGYSHVVRRLGAQGCQSSNISGVSSRE